MHVDVGFLKSERMRSDAAPNVSFIKAIKLNPTPPKMDKWKQHQRNSYTKKQTKKRETISDAPHHVHQLRPTNLKKKHTQLIGDWLHLMHPTMFINWAPQIKKKSTHTQMIGDWLHLTAQI